MVVIPKHSKCASLWSQLAKQLGTGFRLCLDIRDGFTFRAKEGHGDEITRKNHDVRPKPVNFMNRISNRFCGVDWMVMEVAEMSDCETVKGRGQLRHRYDEFL